MSNPPISCQSAGRPTGGQFAPEHKPDSGITFEAEPGQGQPSDFDLMNELAQILGAEAEWNGKADYLDDAAGIVARSGRPHPEGYEEDPQSYGRDLATWEKGNPPPTDPDGRRDYQLLSRVGRQLGGHDWNADHLEDLANAVGDSDDQDLDMSWRWSAGISNSERLGMIRSVRGRPWTAQACR